MKQKIFSENRADAGAVLYENQGVDPEYTLKVHEVSMACFLRGAGSNWVLKIML